MEIIQCTHKFSFSLIDGFLFFRHIYSINIPKQSIRPCNTSIRIFKFIFYHRGTVCISAFYHSFVHSIPNLSQSILPEIRSKYVFFFHLVINTHHSLMSMIFRFPKRS